MEQEQTYRIVRYFKDLNRPKEIIEEGVSFAEARAHCSDPTTKGEDWFDGFEREE